MRWLFAKLREERDRGEAICRSAQELDKRALKRKILDYVQLYGNALAAVATRDVRRHLDKPLVEMKNKYNGSVRKGEDVISRRLVEKTARTFYEEEQSMRASSEEPLDGAWLLCEEVKEVINSGTSTLPEELRPEMKLGGGSAVRRLLQRLGVAVSIKKLKTFTLQELLDKEGSAMDLNNVVGPNWPRLVRTMVEDMMPVHAQFKMVCLWCKDIYVSQADIVCNILREDVHLLEEFPRLRDLLDYCIQQQYSDAVASITHAAVARIADLSKSSFMHLNMDKIIHSQTIVNHTMGLLLQSGCMLPPDKVDEKPIQDLSAKAEEILCELVPDLLGDDRIQPFQKLLQNMFHQKLSGRRSAGEQQEADNRRQTDMIFSLVQPSGFEVGMDNVEGTPSSVESR
eukprot:2967636-Amphidinium_carterae.1